MDKLTKINSQIAKKQIGRFVGGVASIMLGLILIGKYISKRVYWFSKRHQQYISRRICSDDRKDCKTIRIALKNRAQV